MVLEPGDLQFYITGIPVITELGVLLAGCGGIFQVPRGEIHSPNYPNGYKANTECSWAIQVEKHYRVLFNITDFDLEATDSCIMVSGTNFKHCYYCNVSEY